jgi:hypothetical protein
VSALEILVIILSAFLAIFLLLGIILGILLVRVTRQIKRVTTSAERTVNGLENVVANVGKFSSPALIMKIVASQFNKRRKK